MVHKIVNGCYLVAVSILPVAVGACAAAHSRQEWTIHDTDRPQPPVVDPGSACVQSEERRPPSDAVVLFSGMDLAA